jgi:hypothetical protein
VRATRGGAALISDLRPLLERNRAFAAIGAHTGLAIMPRQQVFLVIWPGTKTPLRIFGRAWCAYWAPLEVRG